MDVGLAVAGIICVAMAVGHETIGDVWILPSLTRDKLPHTPFGSPGMSVAMVRVTWRVVTLFVLSLGVILLVLASFPSADARSVLLRVFAAGWIAATLMASWIALRAAGSLRGILRLPVPLLWVVVAILMWNASA